MKYLDKITRVQIENNLIISFYFLRVSLKAIIVPQKKCCFLTALVSMMLTL